MRTLCGAVGGGLISGLGILFLASMALADEDVVTPPNATNSTETGVIDMNEIDRVDECIDAQVCIDRYLWSLYERTRKVDTVRVPEQIKVEVKKKKGKTRIVTKTISKYIVEDFGWKDPEAAKKAGMAPQDYVIGGMDRAFRVTLYHALRKLENEGLMPGITSAFRDDYRQTIASGLKARSDRSFHGGSSRGGYGHGLAADIVSVKGDTRAERLASSDVLWKWVDDHEQELGIGRPYRDRDAPHVGPLDGREYLAHHVEPKLRVAEKAQADKEDHDKKQIVAVKQLVQETKHKTEKTRHAGKSHATGKTHLAEKKAKIRGRLAMRNDRGISKHARAARPGKARAQSRSLHST